MSVLSAFKELFIHYCAAYKTAESLQFYIMHLRFVICHNFRSNRGGIQSHHMHSNRILIEVKWNQ